MSARQLAAINTDRLFPLGRTGPAARVLRAELPVGVRRGRARAAARRRAAAGAPVVGRLPCCSRSSSRLSVRPGAHACDSQQGPATDPAARPLPSEGDGAASRPRTRCCARIPGATVVDLDAGCCGMAGSFGYVRDHFDVSRAIGERRLLPAARHLDADSGARGERRVLPSPGRGFRRDARACTRRSSSHRSSSGARMSLAVISVCALALAVIVSCVTHAQRRRAGDRAGLDHRRLHRRHAGQHRDGRVSDAAVPHAGGRDAAVLARAVQRHARPPRPSRRARCRGNRGVDSDHVLRAWRGAASMGPGNIATAALVAPMAMATAARSGIPLFLMAIMVGNGANAGVALARSRRPASSSTA